MLAIRNNLMAVSTARLLSRTYDALALSVQRLSSGLRINGAKDDAAGLAVRELIRADVAMLKQGSRNALDGISMFQTMEAAMGVMDESLVRMKELAEQAATGTYSSAQRAVMDAEFAEMADEIERVAGATKFNDINMLNEAPAADGSNDVKIHVATATTIDGSKVDMTKSGLGIDTGDGGWQVDTTSDSAYSASSTTASWITVMQGSGAGAGASVTLVLRFTDTDSTAADEDTINVYFAAVSTGATSYSLAQVVSAINAQSMNLGWDSSGNDLRYSAAETYYDSTTSRYQLRLTSRGTDAETYCMIWSGFETAAGATIGYVSGGFLVSDADGLSVTSTTYMANSGVTQAGLNIKTVEAALTALDAITTAINVKDTNRAAFGYKMSRLEATITILDIQAENLLAAESRISDVDVATEMAKLTSTQVLSQAGVAMLAQANSMPQMALQLLR